MKVNNNKKLKILSFSRATIIMVIVASFLCAIFSTIVFVNITKSIAQTVNLAKSDYDYLCISDQPISENYSYYVDRNIIPHTAMHDDVDECHCSLDVKIIMQSEGRELSVDEMIITYNAAKKYNLKVGDKLYVNLNGLKIKREYKIVKISRVSYGIDTNDFSSYGEATIGYDKQFLRKNPIRAINFIKETNNDNSSVMPIVKKTVYRKSLISDAVLQMVIYTLLGVLAIASCSALSLFGGEKSYRDRLRKGQIMGIKILKLRNFVLLDTLIKNAALYVPSMLAIGLTGIALGAQSLISIAVFTVLLAINLAVMVAYRSRILRRKNAK